MTDIDLAERFPNMRPCKKSPSLHLMNGCGLTVYGRRDYDEETGTYVKTHAFCLLFVPLVALGSYRVADAPEEGWYFIGKEPLSGLAKLWNYLLVGGALTAIGWVLVGNHFHSPEAVAGRKLGQAQKHYEKGEAQEAATLWQEVAGSGTKHADEAKRQIKQAWDETVADGQTDNAAAILPVVVQMADDRRWTGDLAELYKQAVSLADLQAKTDAKVALETINSVEQYAPDETTYNADRRPLLVRLVKDFPDDLEFLSQLAAVYQAEDKLDECERLLAPHVDRLGTTEGARIMGQILAAKGDMDRSRKLLVPYVKERLEAETRYRIAFEKVRRRAIENLEQDRGPADFEWKYKAARSDEERNALVADYVFSELRADPKVAAAQEQVAGRPNVAPVALQLGAMMLRRAQEMADPQARQQELEKAEEIFLALAQVAGETDEYRLYMGQVKYWLGKHDEGRDLFEQLLGAHGRSPEMLIAVSRMLRQVGVSSEARKLAEEAFNTATDKSERQMAARLRALLMVDIEDEITWLERCDPADLNAKADLAMARGKKAIREGREAEAAQHLREGIDIYEKQTETSGTLNNVALGYFSLYRVTGDKSNFDRGVERMERAVKLEPGLSILLVNAGGATLQAAVLGLVSEKADLPSLRIPPNITLLNYLYNDEAGMRAVAQQFVDDPRTKKVLEYADQVMLLAPKNPAGTLQAVYIYGYTRDTEKLQELSRRLDGVELDLTDAIEASFRFYRGEKDDVYRKQAEAACVELQGVLAGIDKAADPATYALGASELVGRKRRAAVYGVDVDDDELVQLAESAVAANLSDATEDTLLEALLFRASRRLARENAEYAKMVELGERSVGHGHLVTVAASGDGPLRDAALASPDVQRVISLITARGERYPTERGVRSWALLRHAAPDEAQKLADIIRNGEAQRLMHSLAFRLAPASGGAAYELYWERLILGQDDEQALEPLRECAARGVPLPLPVE
jgi:hypothetical protein